MAAYPTQLCPVCLNPFTPRRNDQIFCSRDDTQECLQRLHRFERDPQTITQFMQALYAQDGKCWVCKLPGGAPLTKLRILVRYPFRDVPEGDDAPNVVAAHMPCRRGWYWKAAADQLASEAAANPSPEAVLQR